MDAVTKKPKKEQIKHKTSLFFNSDKGAILMIDFLGVAALILLNINFFFGFYLNGTDILLAIFAVYLSYFVSRKELKRWVSDYEIERKGELWVVIWLVITIFMVIMESLYPRVYHLPRTELTIIVPFVLAQYLYSRQAKKYYHRSKKNT